MARKENASNGILDGVIWRALLAFFFPIMLGTLFQQLYNTVDAVVVGQFVGKEALAAVGGSASKIMDLLVGFFVGLSSGATVIVSQFYGAHEDENVSKAVHTAMTLAIAAGVIMTAMGLILAPTLLRWMDTPRETLEDSTAYLRIVFLSMVPSMLYNVGSGILRAIGDSRRPLYFLIVCCLVNVALDLTFVLGFRMGVQGVAVATAIAQCVSAVLVCLSLGRAEGSYRLEPRKLRADGALLGRTMRVGLPSGLQSVMYSLSNMIITATINSFGTATVAAWVTLGKVDGMFWMINNAFGVSIVTFVGQNYGARQYDRVRKGLKVCTALALGAAWLFSGAFLLTGQYVFRIFTHEQDVLEMALKMMVWMAPWYWLFVPIEMISGTLRGMGDTLKPALITAAGICALRVVWMFLLVPRWHEVFAITLSYPISWLLTSIAFVFYYGCVKGRMLPKIRR